MQSITGWQDHILAGRQYLKTATQGLSRPAVFNNELIFQLAAMAIEKIMVGVCQYHQQMPVDHTLSGLVAALAPVCPGHEELAARIKGIEAIDDICTLSAARRKSPDDGAVRQILAVGCEVRRFARQHVPWEGMQTAA
ncbi:MAG: hypothetical protein PVJ53_01635 [Desulfobacterales bacterium]